MEVNMKKELVTEWFQVADCNLLVKDDLYVDVMAIAGVLMLNYD